MYEYLVFRFDVTQWTNITAQLNKFALDRWRVVGTPVLYNIWLVYTLEREVLVPVQ